MTVSVKMLVLPVPQKFNTFNTFNTFSTFDPLPPASALSARPLPLSAAVQIMGSGTDLQARPMAIPAPTAMTAISTATACGDSAPPASQMTTKATAVASRITT